ncbi:MAG TPA: murein biosynthesis integral membrane protein MurJ [Treponemataceae bacterium]|nr:murein biosynthesis integral membrane protein MurJ [Treponemataceae bacterium]
MILKSKKTREKNIFSSGLMLSLLTFMSRILGLIREMTKASLMGTSALADAFSFAFMLPNLFRRLFAENSVSVAFIPTFRSYLDNKDIPKKDTQTFISATLTLVSFLTAATVVLGISAAPLIVRYFSKSESADIMNETILLTRIMFPYLFVISTAALLQGILNAHKVFSPSGFTPILFNIAVIASSYLLSDFSGNPARAMAIGVMAGGIVQAAFQLPFVLRFGWKLSFTGIRTAFSNPGTRRVLRLIAPTILGMAAYQMNDFVSSVIAKNAGEGILSSIQYSLRLQELILGVFAVTIGTVILPDMSSLAKAGKWTEYNTMLSKSLQIIALITIPITLFSLTTGENLIILLYKNKSFTDESVKLTLGAFFFHICGLFFIAVNRILAPAFYAQGDAKSPTFAGIIGFAVNIVLAFLLSRTMKGSGIAIALSAASIVNTAGLFILLKRKGAVDCGFVLKNASLYALKMTILSLIAITPVYLLKSRIFSIFEGSGRFIEQGVPIFICGLIFAAGGILLLILTKDSLLEGLIKTVKNKLSKNK